MLKKNKNVKLFPKSLFFHISSVIFVRKTAQRLRKNINICSRISALSKALNYMHLHKTFPVIKC